jgi:hypothetical protein
MTNVQKIVLELLQQNQHRLLRPGHIGEQVWGDATNKHLMPQAWCRPAGKVLRGLERDGLVQWLTTQDDWGWKITRKSSIWLQDARGRALIGEISDKPPLRIHRDYETTSHKVFLVDEKLGE